MTTHKGYDDSTGCHEGGEAGGGRWRTDVKALVEKWPDMEMCLFV